MHVIKTDHNFEEKLTNSQSKPNCLLQIGRNIKLFLSGLFKSQQNCIRCTNQEKTTLRMAHFTINIYVVCKQLVIPKAPNAKI